MIRPDYELHDRAITVSQWTEDEAFSHLKRTFDLAAVRHPDVMEPYLILFADEDDGAALVAIMREALRQTFQARHPRSLKPYQEGE